MGTGVDARDVERKVVKIIAREMTGLDPASITLRTALDVLGVNSMELAIILVEIEEEFGIYMPADERLSNLKNVGDLVADIERRLGDTNRSP